MTLLTLIQQSPPAFVALCAVVGLVVGSFLNVVILRTPRILMHRWQQDCRELSGESSGSAEGERFNLLFPRSTCPHCGHVIRAIENIPVLSYLWLRGRCAACRQPISLRYPVIEFLTAILTATVAWRFGFGLVAIAAIALTWLLISLTFIDIDHHLLPDVMVLPFLWIGLLLNANGTFTDLRSAVIGAAAGYLSLWSVFHAFRLVTGKEGMGYGDFKLLALIGAWLGWQALLPVILMSSILGAVVGIGLIVFRGHDRAQPLPFGPYLAVAGWIMLMWGDSLSRSLLLFAALPR